jgi:EAL domain-containing protein (putative c-di-GMP-specific phosphodiesterase class I)
VAEGVETPGQRQRLRRIGCDEFQGFVFSPALPVESLEALWQPDGGGDPGDS